MASLTASKAEIGIWPKQKQKSGKQKTEIISPFSFSGLRFVFHFPPSALGASQFLARRALAKVPQGRSRIAQHFSAEVGRHRNVSRQGGKTGARDPAVPAGLVAPLLSTQC